MLVSEVFIPKMFTAYAEDQGYPDQRLHQYQYFCEECDQPFAVAWGRKEGCLSWCERGKAFHCPYCSARHETYVVKIQRKAHAPYKVRLVVKAYKKAVILEVHSETVKFIDMFHVVGAKLKERFYFDIAGRTVTWTRWENKVEIESMKLGNPFELDIFKKSILGFFTPYSLANAHQKKELNRLLRTLREQIHNKLERRLGYKVPSLHVSPGQEHGMFLLPLFNIAYRLIWPDAPNLPAEYRMDKGVLEDFWSEKMIFSKEHMTEALILARREKSMVKTLITAYSLPDIPAVRRILGEDPFDANRLLEAFRLTKNNDLAIRLFEAFKKLKKYADEDLLQLLRNIGRSHEDVGIVQFVEREKEIPDCVRLYRLLSKGNRQAIQDEKVKLGDLHDWMALKHQMQTHKNLPFAVPEYIARRLSMQKDKLKFFLPKESIELVNAGVKLHNCVASYEKAMRDNSSWIVLVADDNGKLAACLEVKDKKLVQAKIDRNKTVSIDPGLNAEVLTWAAKAGLEIATNDVAIPQTEKKAAAAG